MDYNIKRFIGNINPKIIIVEGFEFVGKSYLIDRLVENNDVVEWKPSYGSHLNNRVIDYSDRYTFNIGLIELVESGLIINKPIIVDRGALSGIVYNFMYSQCVPSMNNLEFFEYLHDKYSNPELIHTIYIEHLSFSNCRELYHKSITRNNNESYDKFDGMDNYLKLYEEFDKKYKQWLPAICGNNYSIISSYDLVKIK